jgi:hypothetical protein
MGLLVVSPSHYEGLMWMGLWFVLLASLPIIYNLYNSNNSYLPVIPMQSSMLQTLFFILFMLSMYCTASMLPCGRYYYAPEGGYVGNPWVKFSYQYAYIYMAWILHHLDVVEHYGFNYAQHLLRRHSSIKKFAKARINTPILDRFAASRYKGKARLRYNNAYVFMADFTRSLRNHAR